MPYQPTQNSRNTAVRLPHVVCTVSELAAGQRVIFSFNGLSIGVFNVNGAYHALLNRCPHRGAPLCEGRLTASVTAPQPYSYSRDREGEILKCPWHGWEFDILTGRSVFMPEKIRVKAYPTTIEQSQQHPLIAKYDVSVIAHLVVVWLSK